MMVSSQDDIEDEVGTRETTRMVDDHTRIFRDLRAESMDQDAIVVLGKMPNILRIQPCWLSVLHPIW
jgi:hypothetical protein